MHRRAGWMLKLSFIGYIGANCRTRVDGDNVAITFSVGVSKQYKNRQNEPITKTTWVGCTLWRKITNLGTITNYLVVGKEIYVEGEPSVRAYLDAEQKPKVVLDCRVEKIRLCGSSAPASAPDQIPDKSDNDDLPF